MIALGDQAIAQRGKESSTEEPMDLILIILVLVLLFGGGFGYSRWGYGGGLGIGGILLIESGLSVSRTRKIVTLAPPPGWDPSEVIHSHVRLSK